RSIPLVQSQHPGCYQVVGVFCCALAWWGGPPAGRESANLVALAQCWQIRNPKLEARDESKHEIPKTAVLVELPRHGQFFLHRLNRLGVNLNQLLCSAG